MDAYTDFGAIVDRVIGVCLPPVVKSILLYSSRIGTGNKPEKWEYFQIDLAIIASTPFLV